MKKRSQWIYILSVLLCLTMLFASCDQTPEDTEQTTIGETETSEETTQAEPTETEPPIPEDEKVDYAAKIAEWVKYLTRREQESEAEPTIDVLFDNNETSDDMTKQVRETDNFFILSTRQEKYVEANGEQAAQLNISQSYKVFSKTTGNTVDVFADSVYDSYAANAGEVYYSVSEYTGSVDDAGVLRVVKYTYTDVSEEGAQTPTYEYVATYTYYDAALNVIAADLKEEIKLVSVHGGFTTIELDGKYIVYEDGNKLYEYDKTRGVIIPSVSDTYGDYKYIYTMDDHTDLLKSVQIVDKDYRLVAEYTVSSTYDNVIYTILGDGSLYIRGITYATDDENDYDVVWNVYDKYDEEYTAYHLYVDDIVVSVKDGSTTELDLDFFVGTLISNADEEESFAIKDEFLACQYAEVFKIDPETKALATELSYVILDEKLGVKAELPEIVKNQTHLHSIDENGKLLFKASIIGRDYAMMYYCERCDYTYDYYGWFDGDNYRCNWCDYILDIQYTASSFIYIADPADNTVKLHIDVASGNYELVDGGFIYDGKLYNNDLEEIYDLEEGARDYSIEDGILFVYDEELREENAEFEAPEASTLTIPQANDLASTLEPDTYTGDKYYITGTVDYVSNDILGSMWLRDDNGNDIYVNATYSADGSDMYYKLDTKPEYGDVITLYGVIGPDGMCDAWIVAYTPEGMVDGTVTKYKIPYKSVKTCSIVDGEAVFSASWDYDPLTDNMYKVGSYFVVQSKNYDSARVIDLSGNVVVACSSIYNIIEADGCAIMQCLQYNGAGQSYYEYYIIK